MAAAALSPADIAVATRALMRKTTNVTVLMAEVSTINVNQQVVHFSNGDTLPYDYLILAVGAKYNFFGHNTWTDKMLVLKSLQDALSMREHLLSAFERAEFV